MGGGEQRKRFAILDGWKEPNSGLQGIGRGKVPERNKESQRGA